ncbi:MAG: phosphate signaling complex protein PhoU [Firmicutes bacterium]|nr:phosphate signaling complex protein PhoU [Bacillota bacterium]
MRKTFDEELDVLNQEIIETCALCEEAITLASESFLSGDEIGAKRVYPIDSEIDHMSHSIETHCMKLLLRQQPVAGDFRKISAALKMVSDMERIGDMASNIAEIIGYLGGVRGDEVELISGMARETVKMVSTATDAYIKNDFNLAANVIESDDIIDDYFIRVKQSLATRIASHPDEGEYELDSIIVAKYFERIGDHATNIAEWVQYSIDGVIREEDRYDDIRR